MLSRSRALFTRVVLLLGAATFLYLLFKFDPTRVWGQLVAFGWGFAALLPFQIFDHSLNAVGWKLAFPPESAGGASFWDLVRVRIAGDGVNYLTPSAQIGGEFVRPGMMRSSLPDDVKVTSVLIAKITQSVGQAFFILSGLGFLLHAHLFRFEGRQATMGAIGVGGTLFGLVLGTSLLIIEPPAWFARRFPKAVEASAGVRGLLKSYLKTHPVRLLGSIFFFMLGYAWGAAEIWLICHFLGRTLSVETAFSIEFLSNLVDALAFWVPAKIGTQEAGKAAIFAGFGLPAELGFTVGIIRHVRELCWAAFGLSLYAAHQRRRERASLAAAAAAAGP
ncbi:MAG TPA: lysylphosphatidylglycerol synthase domain-containing protein [Elusimicrobiota bacterium]|nr:lysylphosphatidylglycerol synthase domain-containing protein [Elusimicrobiota bacterium]